MKLSEAEEKGSKIKKFNADFQKPVVKESDSVLLEIRDTLKEILKILRSK